MWAIYTYHISSLTVPRLVYWSKKVHICFKKNPPAKFSGYGPGTELAGISNIVKLSSYLLLYSYLMPLADSKLSCYMYIYVATVE